MKQLMSNAYGPRYRTTCRAGVRLVLSASIAIAVAGCSKGAPYTEKESSKFADLSIWADPETDCRYFMFRDGRRGGMTIRYNADGTPDCPSDTDGHPQGGNAKQVPSDSLTVGPEGYRP